MPKYQGITRDFMALFCAVLVCAILVLFGQRYSVKSEPANLEQELRNLRQSYSVATTESNKTYLRHRILDTVRSDDVKKMPQDLQAFYMFIELSNR